MTELIEHLLNLINDFNFLLAFDGLTINSEIYSHLYNLICQNNFTYILQEDNSYTTNPFGNIIYSIQQFENNRCWFEYQLKTDSKKTQTETALLCVFKRLLLELNNHTHLESLEKTDFDKNTSTYLLLMDLLENFY